MYPSIVILAAGRGERFAIEGISVPKPLIEFRGRSLLQHSVQTAKRLVEEARIIVVTTEAVAPSAERLKGVDYVVPVSVIQPGPVASAMLALAHCPADDPVIFMDCDNFYPDIAHCVPCIPQRATFLSVAPVPVGLSVRDFLNVRVDDGGRVFALEEKGSMSNCFVGTGIYGFENAKAFRFHAMTIQSFYKKEPPMSDVTKAILADNEVLALHFAPWMPIGTPQQLMEAARHANQEPV